MSAIGRILVLPPALHHFADFGPMGRSEASPSAFGIFEHRGLEPTPGVIMKDSKSQPLQPEHEMQGAVIKLDTNSNKSTDHDGAHSRVATQSPPTDSWRNVWNRTSANTVLQSPWERNWWPCRPRRSGV